MKLQVLKNPAFVVSSERVRIVTLFGVEPHG